MSPSLQTSRPGRPAGKPRQRPYTDHKKVAAEAKAQPGEWVLVNEYRSTGTAEYTVRAIRGCVRYEAYQPAGCFEAKASLTDDGTAVYVRYVDLEGGAA